MITDDSEIWKPIPGFKRYRVSTIGRVCRLAYTDSLGRSWKERFVKPTSMFEVDVVSSDGVSVRKAIANLMLLAFTGSPPNGKRLARHLDDNRENNILPNLAWGNHKDNGLDAVRNGKITARLVTDAYREECRQRMLGSTLNRGRKHKPEFAAILRTRKLGTTDSSETKLKKSNSAKLAWARRREKTL